ncbi:MAG TPA: TetR/AcrR family transcriptional regulator [Vitreimonas sp.]|uniref:TetR/AcrR family transcriptional regulator n=1 Tax=Vitreimonas sp. TaxID=3069702 RepID=UPI002D6D6F2C|nr:TetR/AcrR family transcriptional regulator [Vitreimonas sp.]HYD87670.1 TetR/AcrR family transcriptional regulator [Vitreimonas sp.]
MSAGRKYVSPKREAQAQATRAAILEAFAEQLSEPGRTTLSPSEAAARAGVSLRTVHFHFPNEASQIAALGQWFDAKIFPEGIELPSGPDDLPRYYRYIHKLGLAHPITRALTSSKGVWKEVRASRRAERLDAIRRAVKAIGAPKRATEDATAVLLSLAGGDASWALVDHGLSKERAPDAIAHTVALVVADLRAQVRK